MEELERRIAILQRKTQREKVARESAEKQLENYSLESYRANQKQKKRARELQFLVESSAQIATDKSLLELVAYYTEITQDYTESLFACYHIPNTSENTDSHRSERQLAKGWLEPDTLLPLISEQLPITNSSVNEQWLVCPVLPNIVVHEYELAWLLFLSFEFDNDRHGWFCFLNEDRYIDDDMLFVLNTSKEHIINGIKRKRMERNIQERNQELQRTVEQLQLTQNQLVQSEKMAVLGQMSAGIAHEINNPISFVKSNIHVLTDYWQDMHQWVTQLQLETQQGNSIDHARLSASLDTLDYQFLQDDVSELLKATSDGVKRVAELVADLKTFVHPGQDKMSKGNIKHCIENAINIASAGLSENTQIHLAVPDTLPELRYHEGKLQQVFINLLVNAGQAMPVEGGTVWIKGDQQNNCLIITVADDGCGMTQETIDKLFTPFFTTKPVGDGTGLGLSITYAILDSHQATIDVHSEVGQGTTFTLCFPLNTQHGLN